MHSKSLRIFIGLVWLSIASYSFYLLYHFLDLENLSLVESFTQLQTLASNSVEILGIQFVIFFFLFYIFRPILFFPIWILTSLFAVLFGPLLGFVLAYIGDVLSAIFGFFFSRYIMGDFFKSYKMFNKFDRYVTKSPVVSTIFFRMIPLFPYDSVNYGFGITEIKFKSYIIGTSIGTLPWLLVYISLGSSLYYPDLFLPTIVLGIVMLVLIKLWSDRRKGS